MKKLNFDALTLALKQFEQGLAEANANPNSELNTQKADLVYSQAKLFLPDAKKLLEALKRA